MGHEKGLLTEGSSKRDYHIVLLVMLVFFVILYLVALMELIDSLASNEELLSKSNCEGCDSECTHGNLRRHFGKLCIYSTKLFFYKVLNF